MGKDWEDMTNRAEEYSNLLHSVQATSSSNKRVCP
jgi:hypothetical protein